jgi:hypothetical protein
MWDNEDKTNREIRKADVRKSIAQDKANGGFMPSRVQEMVADRSPVRGFGRGDPFFDPWAPGGTFNRKGR